MCVCVNVPQDEFKRWFLAKVRVMLAPGKDPFSSLDSESTTHMANGHTPHPSDASAKGFIRKYAEYQPVQVHTILPHFGHRYMRIDIIVTHDDQNTCSVTKA